MNSTPWGIFRPGSPPSGYGFGPHAASWWTAGPAIPWRVIALIAAAVLAARIVAGWLEDRYEVTRRRLIFPTGFRVTRRWYGTHAHVVLRSGGDDADADRYVVLWWFRDNLAVPWLQVRKLSPEYLTCWDEGSEAFCAPVTDFAPDAVRRLRPWIFRYGWLRVPVPFSYLPLRRPAGYLGTDA